MSPVEHTGNTGPRVIGNEREFGRSQEIVDYATRFPKCAEGVAERIQVLLLFRQHHQQMQTFVLRAAAADLRMDRREETTLRMNEFRGWGS